jgi:type IV pilus assembly protein PilN
MSKINLLPWRQELRKQRQQEFVAIVAAVAIVAVAIILFVNMALSKQISDQEEKNQYIKSEITRLDGQIKEIDDLQKRKEQLLSRMKVIQDLQGRRPVIVRVFDELVRVIPEGVYLRSLSRTGDTFKMDGVAENAGQVSTFMRNLEASPWFKDPLLSTVAAEQIASSAGKPGSTDKSGSSDKQPQQGSKFALTVSLETPEKPADDKAQGTQEKK